MWPFFSLLPFQDWPLLLAEVQKILHSSIKGSRMFVLQQDIPRHIFHSEPILLFEEMFFLCGPNDPPMCDLREKFCNSHSPFLLAM
jgi:hypothetical protein